MYGIKDLESSSKNIDLESGTILPVNSQWPFIRKVYSIITFQMLLNIAVASVVVFDQPVANFFATTTQGLVLYIVLIFVPFLRKVILESLILTTSVVFCWTLYTFWAEIKGHNFSFFSSLVLFLLGVLLDFILFTLIQVLHPLDKLSHMIYGCLGAIIFCGYIVFDTHNLIKIFSIDDYIVGSTFMYLDIINLFVYLLENLFDLLCICHYADCNCLGCGDCFYCGDCGDCCGDCLDCCCDCFCDCGDCGDCDGCGDCGY
ncbi:protein LIFEGUARD 4-like [Trifolium pratense]|uniref:protein LIFEGUARD 4-like n=1 Tax=Trifolium pratense TaxID=57577 RepID=UPI001E6943C5|nr:protein LIFEGUARD 4-like [Trifolium pratense]